MIKTASLSKNFHIKVEDSWSQRAVLSKKGGQPLIILAGYEVERNVQLLPDWVAGEALFPGVSQGSFKQGLRVSVQ